MTGRLLYFSITAAFAGFLFGFDTAVVSGAEKTVQQLWQLGDTLHGLATGSALWGTVLGALLGGWPTDRLGRRRTLIGIGALYLVGAVWSALAPDVYSFMAARFLGGVGVGISTVAAPLYISEIAPPAARGRLAGLFQFNIVLGIVVAYASNRLLLDAGEHAWRWMLGVMAAPALLYTLLALGLPESPRWLIGVKRDRARGIEVLRRTRPQLSPAEREAVADEIAAADVRRVSAAGFWSARLRKPILLAFLIALFNQLSGINAVIYFAPRIFELTGLEKQAALLQSVGIGVTNLVFTFVGLWLIDRLGRRTLLVVGSVGYIASLGLCSWAFYTGHYAAVPASIFAFIAAHAVGQGAVIWVFIAEIFPDQYRAAGQSLGSSTHWVAAAVITTVFPVVVGVFHPGTVFAFFCGMMVLQLVWAVTMVPETKGVPLEAIERKLGVVP